MTIDKTGVKISELFEHGMITEHAYELIMDLLCRDIFDIFENFVKYTYEIINIINYIDVNYKNVINHIDENSVDIIFIKLKELIFNFYLGVLVDLITVKSCVKNPYTLKLLHNKSFLDNIVIKIDHAYKIGYNLDNRRTNIIYNYCKA